MNTMKNIFCLALVCFLTTGLMAQTTPEPVEAPPVSKDILDNMTEDPQGGDGHFEFNNEVFDFGEVIEGEKAEHEFVFKNTGSEPIIIEKVKASCGCTTPQWPKTPIAPGQEAVIKAIYNSKGRPGKFNKAIRITSNSDEPTKVLYIKGEVIKGGTDDLPFKKPSIINQMGGDQ